MNAYKKRLDRKHYISDKLTELGKKKFTNEVRDEILKLEKELYNLNNQK